MTFYRAFGAIGTGTTSATGTLPTRSSGDYLLAFVGWGNSVGSTPTTSTAGWSSHGSLLSPTAVAYGTDTGKRGIAVFGGWSDQISDAITVNNNFGSSSTAVVSVVIVSVAPSVGRTIVPPTSAEVSFGSDTSVDTALSLTGSPTLNSAVGDTLVTSFCWVPDTATVSALTQSLGNTTGTNTFITGGANSGGADLRLTAYYKDITGGSTMSGQPTASGTLSASGQGVAAWVLMRDVAPPAALDLGPGSIVSMEQVSGGTTFSDDFNRADSPSLGDQWFGSLNKFSIANGQTVGGSSSMAVRYQYPSPVVQQFSEAQWLGNTILGVCVAMPDFAEGVSFTNTGTWYAYRMGTGGVSQIIQKDDAAASVTILETGGPTWATNDVIKLTYDGTTLRGHVNDVEVISHTPASPISGQNYVGLFQNTNSTEGLPAWDNWTGGSTLGGGVTVTKLNPVLTLGPTAMSSSEGVGLPARTSSLSVAAGSTSSAEMFGIPTRTSVLATSSTGIISAQSLGSPSVSLGALAVTPSGVASAEVFGNPERTSSLAIAFSSINSLQSFGAASVGLGSLALLTPSISSLETVSVVSAALGALTTLPSPLDSPEAWGTALVTVLAGVIDLSPGGVESQEAISGEETDEVVANNYAPNPSFEVNTSAVSSSSGTLSIQRSSEEAWVGSWGIKEFWNTTPATTQALFRCSSLGNYPSGTTRTFKIRFKAPSTNVGPVLSVQVNFRDDAAGVFIPGGSPFITPEGGVVPDQWNEFSITYTVPEGYTLGSIYWRSNVPSRAQTDVYYWDGFQVNDRPDEPYFDGDTPSPIPEDPKAVNLCVNPSVEAGGGWNTWNAANWTITTDLTVFHSGTRSRRGEAVASSPVLAQIAHIGRSDFTLSPVVQGKQYQYGLYVRVATSNLRARLFHVERSSLGGNLATNYGEFTPLTPGVWTRITMPVSLTHASAVGTVLSAEVQTVDGSNAPLATYAWFDSAMLVEGTELPPYFDGSYPGHRWTGTAHASPSIHPVERYEWIGTPGASPSVKHQVANVGGPIVGTIDPLQTIEPSSTAGEGTVNPVTISATLSSTPSSIDDVSEIGSPSINLGSLSTNPSSVTSAQAIGSPSVTLVALSLVALAVSSSQSFGVPSVTGGLLRLTATAISSAQGLGSGSIILGALSLITSGVPSTEAPGSPVVSMGGLALAPSPISSAQALGVGSVTTQLTLLPGAFFDSSGFGAAVRTSRLIVSPTGVVSQADVPMPDIVTQGTLGPDSVEPLEAHGLPSLGGQMSISVTSIVSAQSFGSVSVTSQLSLSFSGISSAQGIGSPTLQLRLTITPSMIASGEAIGSLQASLGSIGTSPESIASANILGLPIIDREALTMGPAGISSAQSVGVPQATLRLTLLAASILSLEALGVSRVAPWVDIFPAGMWSEDAYGQPRVDTPPPETRTLSPAGVSSEVAFGLVGVSYDLSTIPDIVMNASLLARNKRVTLESPRTTRRIVLDERVHVATLLPREV